MRACVRACVCANVRAIVLLSVRFFARFGYHLVRRHSFVRSSPFIRSFACSLSCSFTRSVLRSPPRTTFCSFVRSFVCFLVSFSLRSFVYSVYLFHCFHSLASWPLHPSLSSLSPISDCLTLLNNPIPFFFHRLETCPIPAVFDSTGPVREMFENFAPQVKPTERHSIPKVPQRYTPISMYRYIGDTFAQQQQHKDSFTKNGCLDKQTKKCFVI